MRTPEPESGFVTPTSAAAPNVRTPFGLGGAVRLRARDQTSEAGHDDPVHLGSNQFPLGNSAVKVARLPGASNARVDGMPAATILVLTQPFDPTADYVVEELNRRRVRVLRCDPGEFPLRLTLSAHLDDGWWHGGFHHDGQELDLDTIRCVYYRRPTAFEYPADMAPPERAWAAREARAGFGGVISLLSRWLNHPAAIAWADLKSVQLAYARQCRLAVPRTIVTNDPATARAFIGEVGRAVYKSLAQPTVTYDDGPLMIYTTPVAASDIDQSVGLTAHLFQPVDRTTQRHGGVLRAPAGW